MTGPRPKPTFLTNRDDESVAASLNAHLAHLRTTLIEPYELAIASGYFNIGGYQLMPDELDYPREVRLLGWRCRASRIRFSDSVIGALGLTMAWIRSAVTRSGSGISAIFASTSLSPTKSPEGPRFRSLSAYFIAARSSSANNLDALTVVRDERLGDLLRAHAISAQGWTKLSWRQQHRQDAAHAAPSVHVRPPPFR